MAQVALLLVTIHTVYMAYGSTQRQIYSGVCREASLHTAPCCLYRRCVCPRYTSSLWLSVQHTPPSDQLLPLHDPVICSRYLGVNACAEEARDEMGLARQSGNREPGLLWLPAPPDVSKLRRAYNCTAYSFNQKLHTKTHSVLHDTPYNISAR